MTSQSGGSVNGYPGVASDGASGLDVTGGVSVNGGDPGDAPGDATPYASFAGYTALTDTPVSLTNGWPVVYVVQQSPLTGDEHTPGMQITRQSVLNGHDNTSALIRIEDDTASSGALILALQGGNAAFTVNHVGGVGQYGHTAPATQPAPTIATSTITDAVAKAAIKALILIINNSGAALITET